MFYSTSFVSPNWVVSFIVRVRLCNSTTQSSDAEASESGGAGNAAAEQRAGGTVKPSMKHQALVSEWAAWRRHPSSEATTQVWNRSAHEASSGVACIHGAGRQRGSPARWHSRWGLTQYNTDTHNTHTHSPLWTHVHKPYPYEHLRRTEHRPLRENLY
jgi:hypothetical protein